MPFKHVVATTEREARERLEVGHASVLDDERAAEKVLEKAIKDRPSDAIGCPRIFRLEAPEDRTK